MDWGNILFLGVVATGVAFTWYYAGIRAIGAARAGIFINLVPVFTIALSMLIMGERLSLLQLICCAVILLGVMISQQDKQLLPKFK